MLIGGSPVETILFHLMERLQLRVIETTDYSLIFALLAFTRDDIAQSVIDETNFFVTPVGAIEEET